MPVNQTPDAPPQTDLPPEVAGKLGRLKDPPDSRDYDAGALLEQVRRQERIERQNARTWFPPRSPQDQDAISKCTRMASLHRYLGAPHEHRKGPLPYDTTASYHVVQARDEWQGGERWPARAPGQRYYEGSSVRASLELDRVGFDCYNPADGQFPGFPDLVIPKTVHSYWRLTRWDDFLDYLLAKRYDQGGSVVVGTDWRRQMTRVDGKGFLYAGGDLLGGHAWHVYRANISRNELGGQNSWGTDPRSSGMGPMGRFLLPLEGPLGMRRLFDEDGDLWAVVELGTPMADTAARAVAKGGLT